MITVNLFDKTFAHSVKEDGFDTNTCGRKPSRIKWTRDNTKWDGITVFTDLSLRDTDSVDCEYKVAWIIEPREVNPSPYSEITSLEDKFDGVITYDPSLLARSSKYIKCGRGTSWIKDEDQQIYDKTKRASIITSYKAQTEGHQLRHAIIKACPQLDAYGYTHLPFVSRLLCTKDYMFNVAIENAKQDNWFTEKLIDCFLTGTVPVYWGCSNINEYFNVDGIVPFSSLEELSKIKLSEQQYNDMLPAIRDNFNRAKKYVSSDDLIADILSERFNL